MWIVTNLTIPKVDQLLLSIRSRSLKIATLAALRGFKNFGVATSKFAR